MKVKNPTSPGSRFIIKNDYKGLSKGTKPLRNLCVPKRKIDGRDDKGHISIRHRGGGHKKKFRIVDFIQTDLGEKVKVLTIEYDPNRTAYIARIETMDGGGDRYILAVDGIKEGQELQIGSKAEPVAGNRLPLKNIPVGLFVCNIELKPGKGGIFARAAGSGAQLTAVDSGMAQITLNSGEIRLVKDNCLATIGFVGNKEHHNERLGKAGVSRVRGKRPVVRGAAMNPVDHPHGGGEGKAPVGILKGPKTPWGKLARGKKTRKKGKYSDKIIIKRRKGKR